MVVSSIINILESYKDEKVILVMLTRQDFGSDDAWSDAYHGRFNINWDNVSLNMIEFSRKFEEHMDYNMPIGSTASDLMVFLNKYFPASEKTIANIFTIRDFPLLDPENWIAFASLISDDYPTDNLSSFTY